MAHVKLRPLVGHDSSTSQPAFIDPSTPDTGPPSRPPSVLSPTSRHKPMVPAPPDASNCPAEDPGVSKIRSKLRRLLGAQGQGLNQSVSGPSGAPTPSLSKSGSFRSTASMELNSGTASPHRPSPHTPTSSVPRGRFASAIIAPTYPHPPPTTPPGTSTPLNPMATARPGPTPPLQPPPTAAMAPPGSPAAASASVRGLTLRRAVSFSPTTTFPPLNSSTSTSPQPPGGPMVLSSSGMIPGPGGVALERAAAPRASFTATHSFQVPTRTSGMVMVPEDEALPEDTPNSEPGAHSLPSNANNAAGRCGQYVDNALRNSVSADTETTLPTSAVDGTVYVLAPGGGGIVRQISLPAPCGPDSGRVMVRNSNSGNLSIGSAAAANAALLEPQSSATPPPSRGGLIPRNRASGSASGGSANPAAAGLMSLSSGQLRLDPATRASLSSPAATPRGPYHSVPHQPTPPTQPHPPQPPSISLPLQPTQPTQFIHHLAAHSHPHAAPAVAPSPHTPSSSPMVSTSGMAQAPPSHPPSHPTLTRGMSALSLVSAGGGRISHGAPGSAWSTGAGGGGGSGGAAGGGGTAMQQQSQQHEAGGHAGGGGGGGAAVMQQGGAGTPPSTAQSVRRTHSTIDATAIRAQSEIPPSSPAGSLMAIGAGMPAEMRRKEWRMEDFTLLKKLYKGNYSAVHKALDRTSMRLVVVKVYDTTRMTELARNHVRREAALHSQLDHDNILNLYAVFQQGPYVLLIEEVAEGGDLYHVLKGVPGHRLQEDRAVIGVLLPLLRALGYLHEQGICHRDIKLENILFSDRHHTHMLLADFGIALSLRQERAVTRAGTTEYMSPEQLRCPFKRHPSDNKDRTDLHYGLGVDVWATGVLAYELLHGYPPFLGANREETEQLIATAAVQVAPQLSSGARDFVLSCLQKDPAERPTVQQLMQHPWMRAHMRQPRN
ncbi:hypothetical protein Agub_g8617 [Astrephomene gubernaculifera]|uniref:Protein kinase domain-containing protein n=1 Tax=Astrephomene gubernaculifera TaxID=47775 RepID=A0AAD3DRY6_9CHLO|nr:hypothetical protein Agub_g8617 [Astrephomene gubernaculifera]